MLIYKVAKLQGMGRLSVKLGRVICSFVFVVCDVMSAVYESYAITSKCRARRVKYVIGARNGKLTDGIEFPRKDARSVEEQGWKPVRIPELATIPG
jgi:hypothetical protein